MILPHNGDYQFHLVDFSRMNFNPLSFNERLKNFVRLTPDKEKVEIMADEYTELIQKNEAEVFEKMWHYNQEFFSKREKNQA